MNDWVMAEVSVVPLGTSSPSLSAYVAEVERVARSMEGVRSCLTPMATVLEGRLDDVLAAVKAMHLECFRHGALRVSTRLVLDQRVDRLASMEGKIASVEQRLEEGN